MFLRLLHRLLILRLYVCFLVPFFVRDLSLKYICRSFLKRNPTAVERIKISINWSSADSSQTMLESKLPHRQEERQLIAVSHQIHA